LSWIKKNYNGLNFSNEIEIRFIQILCGLTQIDILYRIFQNKVDFNLYIKFKIQANVSVDILKLDH